MARIHTNTRAFTTPRSGRLAARYAGFTLVELLVAMAIMALMAMLSWRALDAMVRVQAHTQERADELLALQAGLAQWKADLDAVAMAPALASLDWDGRALRLTRRAVSPADGLLVVAWTRREQASGQWLRWQSPVLRTAGAWDEAWRRAALWAQGPAAADDRQEVAIAPLQDWKILYYQNHAWTSPVSAAGGSSAVVPDGIRLLLDLPTGQALGGKLTLDWVRPTLGGNAS